MSFETIAAPERERISVQTDATMSTFLEDVATEPDGEIKAVTSKRIVNKKPRTLNLKQGDKIIVKIVANMDEFGFHKKMKEYVKQKNPKPTNSFYAIAKIKEVERLTGHKFGTPYLAFPQPTIEPIEIELEDNNKKIRIRATDKEKDKDESNALRNVKNYDGFSHLLTKSACKNDTSKIDCPYHTAVVVDGQNEGRKNFVFVHFSGEKEMTEKMKQDQKKAVNGWFKNYIFDFDYLFRIHKRVKEREKIEEEEQRKREADPEFQRQQQEFNNNWFKQQFGYDPRRAAPASSAPNTWSGKCGGKVRDLDKHLKMLGINRDTDAPEKDIVSRMKKKRSKLLHSDRCPGTFEGASEDDKKWFKNTFDKERPADGKECDDYLKIVNSSIDELNKCFP